MTTSSQTSQNPGFIQWIMGNKLLFFGGVLGLTIIAVGAYIWSKKTIPQPKTIALDVPKDDPIAPGRTSTNTTEVKLNPRTDKLNKTIGKITDNREKAEKFGYL